MTVSDAYADFLLATDDYHQSLFSGRSAIDAVSLQNYSLRRAFTGKDPKKVIQNGKTIKNYIQLQQKGTAHFFGVGGTESPSQPQLLTEMETPWAFFRDDITWDEEIFDLHEGDMAERFVNLRSFQEAACWQEKIRFLEEEAFWAIPDEASMEAISPKPAIRHVTPWNVLVNENANTLPYDSDGTTAWTTVQQISPTTYTNWQCQQKTYIGGPTQADDSLLPGLSDTSRRCRFRGLPLGKGMYSDKSTMPAVIWCSFDGYTMLEETMRNKQDLFVYMGRQDPTYPGITIHGVPVEELPILETAAIYRTGAADVYSIEKDNQGTAIFGGPRYYFMNLADMYVVVHSRKFFYKHKQLTPHNMPNRHSVFVDSYTNLTAETRRSSGIVYPGADIAGYSTAV